MKWQYFTDEHELFRKTIRQFIENEVVPHAEEWEKQERIPKDIYKKMGELGYLGINFPENYGGAELDFFYTVVFLEELARCTMAGFAAAVSIQAYLSVAHIFGAGSEELKQKYVVPSIAGELVGALAITEPDAGSDVNAIRTKAVRDGDHYVINGSKTFITNGVFSDFVTAAVKTVSESGTEGMSMIVIDRDTPGFTARQLKKMGWHSSDTGELSFEDARVPAANLIGEEGMGFYYIMESFQLERLVAAILFVAGAEHCMEITLQYISERKAFGRPLNRFQVIRHKLAQIASELEASKCLTYQTCWLHQNGEHAVRECSMAKLVTSEVGKRIADECLQFFGGYGYMNEYLISRMYRDARIGTIGGGTSEIMREIISRMMIDDTRYDAAYKK